MLPGGNLGLCLPGGVCVCMASHPATGEGPYPVMPAAKLITHLLQKS